MEEELRQEVVRWGPVLEEVAVASRQLDRLRSALLASSSARDESTRGWTEASSDAAAEVLALYHAFLPTLQRAVSPLPALRAPARDTAQTAQAAPAAVTAVTVAVSPAPASSEAAAAAAEPPVTVAAPDDAGAINAAGETAMDIEQRHDHQDQKQDQKEHEQEEDAGRSELADGREEDGDDDALAPPSKRQRVEPQAVKDEKLAEEEEDEREKEKEETKKPKIEDEVSAPKPEKEETKKKIIGGKTKRASDEEKAPAGRKTTPTKKLKKEDPLEREKAQLQKEKEELERAMREQEEREQQEEREREKEKRLAKAERERERAEQERERAKEKEKEREKLEREREKKRAEREREREEKERQRLEREKERLQKEKERLDKEREKERRREEEVAAAAAAKKERERDRLNEKEREREREKERENEEREERESERERAKKEAATTTATGKRGRGARASDDGGSSSRTPTLDDSSSPTLESSPLPSSIMAGSANFMEAELPLSKSPGPLCGAIRAPPEYIIPVGTPVAARTAKASRSRPAEWLLATVVRYIAEKQRYEVVDADPEETENNRKRYLLPRPCVIPLPTSLPESWSKGGGTQFSKGMMVLAMFPNTTAFYPATVQVGPRRRKDKNYVLLFDDDEEDGQKCKRYVSPRFVVHYDK